jgi:hypothetical protein
MRFQSAAEFGLALQTVVVIAPLVIEVPSLPVTLRPSPATAFARTTASPSARRDADGGGVRHAGDGPLCDSILTIDGASTGRGEKDPGGPPATGSGAGCRGVCRTSGFRRCSTCASRGTAGDSQTGRRPAPSCAFLRTVAPAEQTGEKLRDPCERSRPSAGGNPATASACSVHLSEAPEPSLQPTDSVEEPGR